MPDNVDLNRRNTNRINNGWIFRRHNARSRFICIYCTRFQSPKKRINAWSSVYTTILFRARLDRSPHGQNIGRIQMKIFEQGCQTCNMYSIGILDEKEIKKTFYWLYIWILEIFYNVKLTDDNTEEFYDQPNGQNRGQVPHDSSRCDGCRVGWCKSLRRNNLKRHTILF
jgi:hypothetical protein